MLNLAGSPRSVLTRQRQGEEDSHLFIFTVVSLCCVLDFQTPSGYSVWGQRQMDDFPSTYSEEPVGINVRSICVNRVWAVDVWSKPHATVPPSLFISPHLWEELWRQMHPCLKSWYMCFLIIQNDSFSSMMKSDQLLLYGDDFTTVSRGMEPIWNSSSEFLPICQTGVHLGQPPLQLHTYVTSREAVCMN